MIRLTHQVDGSIFMVNELQIESIVEVVDGTMVQVNGKQTRFVVKETLEQIEDMILRDQFAMSAINGLISGLAKSYDDWTVDTISKYSYDQADAMLKQRKEK